MTILLVVEGGAKVGLGHLLRCRALMQALARCGMPLVLALSGEAEAMANWTWPPHKLVSLRDGLASITDSVLNLAAQYGARWVIVDGYGLQATDLMTRLRRRRHRVLAIDDIAEHKIDADIILNQNVMRNDLYPGYSDESLLLGPDYVLLADEYIGSRGKRGDEKDIDRVLVSFGGSDLRSFSSRIVTGLTRLPRPPKAIDVVVGPFHKSHAAVQAPGVDIVYHRALTDLSPLMLRADLMISAAGSTCWQACCVGVPLVAVQTVANQCEVAAILAACGAAKVLDGDRLSGDSEAFDLKDIAAAVWERGERAALSSSARTLVDGQGAQRVATILNQKDSGQVLS